MSDLLSPAEAGAAWVVIHARPRCEKKVATLASQRPARVYLPMRVNTRKYGARVRKSELPLFTGYLFVVADATFRQWLRQNQYVARVIDVPEQVHLLEQLQQIERALAAGAELEVMPYLEIGRRVRVARGPLRGLEGVVRAHKGKMRLVVNLDIIRESVSVEIDTQLLEPGRE